MIFKHNIRDSKHAIALLILRKSLWTSLQLSTHLSAHSLFQANSFKGWFILCLHFLPLITLKSTNSGFHSFSSLKLLIKVAQDLQIVKLNVTPQASSHQISLQFINQSTTPHSLNNFFTQLLRFILFWISTHPLAVPCQFSLSDPSLDI